MSSLYTPAMKSWVESLDWPRYFNVGIQEHEMGLTLVFYRDNWRSLSGTDKLRAVALMDEVLTKVNATGMPMGIDERTGDGRA